MIALDRLVLSFAPRPWAFAEARRAEIDAHFGKLQRENPALWNGRVLLLHSHEVAGREFRGSYLETDFASFIAWRDWGFPDASMRNCFALGALRGSDGGFLLGVMAAHTANPGKIYFPSGIPDPTDIVGGAVDLEGNVLRELREETGLTPADFAMEPGWRMVLAGPRIAMVKIAQTREPAETLRQRILDRIRGERDAELSGIHIARGPSDFDPMMPTFITAFLAHAWR